MPLDTSQAASALKSDIAGANPNIVVQVGYELFRQMIADHVLTEEKFSVLSTEFMLHKAWAFDKTHYALFDPILQDDECRIGGMQVHKISQV